MEKRGKYKRTKEHRKKMSEVQKGFRHSQKSKNEMRDNPTSMFDNRRAIRHLCECGFCNEWASAGKEFVWGHNNKGEKNPMKNPNIAKNHSKTMKRYYREHPEAKMTGDRNPMKRPEVVAKLKNYLKNHPEALLKTWKASLKASNRRPTKPERRLRNRLSHLFPREYKYVGDGDTFIGGKCPDFININRQKKIIEMFGDYWHGEKRTKRTKYHEEQRRIRHFAKYGYKTLIVWQKELENIPQLKRKLLEFHNEKI